MMQFDSLAKTLVSALAFSALGIVLFAVAFLIIVKVTPFSLRKEIEEDQNTSLAIIIASVILGIALIVSAAIHS
jgi:putative membrane protein